MPDRIEKSVEIKAPVARVWRALTDYREFGEWFRVKLESPFVPGQSYRGQITWPGYEHHFMDFVVQQMEPERLFSFTWHPYNLDPTRDYSQETPTLVEFTLEQDRRRHPAKVIESGFDRIPSRPPRRSLPHERQRMDPADGEHRHSCRPNALAARAAASGLAQPRRCLPRSATRLASR